MKDIPDFEGLYAITKKGKVWSYPRVRNRTRYGKPLKAFYDGQWLKPLLKKDGYFAVNLSTRNGKQFIKKIHRLVGLTYIPNPNQFPVVNHKNGIKSDNRVENLEWCSIKENTAHAKAMGLISTLRGEKHPRSRLKDRQVIRIRKLYSSGKYIQTKLGKMFGVTGGHISQITSMRRRKLG